MLAAVSRVADARPTLPTAFGHAYVFDDHRLSRDGVTTAKPVPFTPQSVSCLGSLATSHVYDSAWRQVSYAPQRFTGKERDGETGLDYFGARYFSATQGRFTTPDEFTGGIVDPFTGQQVGQPGPLPYADITDPQTLNKYAYVRNNPLRYTDPDGHIIDELLDAASIIYDVYKIATEGATKTNMAALGADVAAAAVPFVTGAGAAVRLGARADDVVDAARAAEAAVDVKRVPNPFGELGGPAHQAKVEEVAGNMAQKGLEVSREVRIATPGGAKSARYADAVGRDPATGKIREIHQVGKQTKKGQPVSRERKAVEDIEKARKQKVTFDPYND